MMFAVSLVATTITFIKRKFMTQLRETVNTHKRSASTYCIKGHLVSDMLLILLPLYNHHICLLITIYTAAVYLGYTAGNISSVGTCSFFISHLQYNNKINKGSSYIAKSL